MHGNFELARLTRPPPLTGRFLRPQSGGLNVIQSSHGAATVARCPRHVFIKTVFYAANRYAKSKDTDYKKVTRDTGPQLRSRSAAMETSGASSKDLWSLVTVLTDPASHPPHASGD